MGTPEDRELISKHEAYVRQFTEQGYKVVMIGVSCTSAELHRLAMEAIADSKPTVIIMPDHSQAIKVQDGVLMLHEPNVMSVATMIASLPTPMQIEGLKEYYEPPKPSNREQRQDKQQHRYRSKHFRKL